MFYHLVALKINRANGVSTCYVLSAAFSPLFACLLHYFLCLFFTLIHSHILLCTIFVTHCRYLKNMCCSSPLSSALMHFSALPSVFPCVFAPSLGRSPAFSLTHCILAFRLLLNSVFSCTSTSQPAAS